MNHKHRKRATVIAATYNRLEMLKQLLGALEAQTVSQNEFDVIIVDDGSTDGTQDFLAAYEAEHAGWFRHLRQRNKGPAAARNKGIASTEAELILFTDDDCAPRPDWVANYLAFMDERPQLAGAGGPVYGKRTNLISRFIDATRVLHPPGEEDGLMYLVTANACYRRNRLLAVNGFDESFKRPGGEDPDLSERIKALGETFHLCEAAVVLHDHRDTVRGLAETFFNYGKGAANMREEQPRGIGRLLVRPLFYSMRLAVVDGVGLLGKIKFAFLGLLRVSSFISGYTLQKHRLRKGVRSLPQLLQPSSPSKGKTS